jgi:hypothetical protein
MSYQGVTAPDEDGRWVEVRDDAEVLDLLNRWEVPVSAETREARRVLDLSGVWVPQRVLTRVLTTRRDQSAVTSVSSVRTGTQDTGPVAGEGIAA